MQDPHMRPNSLRSVTSSFGVGGMTSGSEDDQAQTNDEAVATNWLLGFHKKGMERRYRKYHTEYVSPQVKSALFMFGTACAVASSANFASNLDMWDDEHGVVYACMSSACLVSCVAIQYTTISHTNIQRLLFVSSATVASCYLYLTKTNLDKEFFCNDILVVTPPVATVYYYLPLFPALLTATGLLLPMAIFLYAFYFGATVTIFLYFRLVHPEYSNGRVILPATDFWTLMAVDVFSNTLFFWLLRCSERLLRSQFVLSERLKKEQVNLRLKVDDPFQLRQWMRRGQRGRGNQHSHGSEASSDSQHRLSLLDNEVNTGPIFNLKMNGEGAIVSNKKSHLGSQYILDFSQIVLEQKIASGSNGQVYKGTYAGAPVALKELFAVMLTGGQDIKEFEKEAMLLAYLLHPNILRFYGVAHDEQRLFMVMELCACSLQDVIDSRDFGIEMYLQFALQIATGMEFLHNNGIIHRDLKPANVLMDTPVRGTRPAGSGGWNGLCKICDFGLARIISMRERQVAASEGGGKRGSKSAAAIASKVAGPGKKKSPRHRQEYSRPISFGIGTPGFTAPEVLCESRLRYDQSADVYSFGIMLWVMHTKETPFKDVAHGAIATATFEGDRPELGDLPSELARLIEDCWAKNPPDRPGFSLILIRLRELRLSGDVGEL
jgi:hypothetical protein